MDKTTIAFRSTTRVDALYLAYRLRREGWEVRLDGSPLSPSGRTVKVVAAPDELAEVVARARAVRPDARLVDPAGDAAQSPPDA